MPSKAEVIKLKRETDTEYAERLKGYSKKWRDNNLEHARSLDRNKANKSRNENRESYNAYMRAWTEKNKERLNEERRLKLKNDPEHAEKIRKRGRENHNPQKHREEMLKKKYGITADDYNFLLKKQSNKCSICGILDIMAGKHKLVVDHCHRSGKIRGLLCGKCNTALGQFNDSIEILSNAIEYLR